MPYVSRDGSNNVTGLFARPQPGRATEFLADDDAEVVAYLTPPPPTYRELRKADYVAQIGPDPTVIETIGDVLDAVIKHVRTDASQDSTEFEAIVAQIDAIKAAHPKP